MSRGALRETNLFLGDEAKERKYINGAGCTVISAFDSSPAEATALCIAVQKMEALFFRL